MPKADLVVVGARQIVTCDPSIGEGRMGLQENSAIAAQEGKIVWVGPESELEKSVERTKDTVEIDAAGRAVIPGFVDAHTHLVFAGNRREEFFARAGGHDYTPAGILDTVRATREATADELLSLARERADLMLTHGTTTVEAKSGYALDAEGELELLQVMNDLHESHPIDLEITFLGAHAIPEEYAESPEGFVTAVLFMMPACAELASWCDVFCDVGAFSAAQAERILLAGKKHGLEPRIHANELGPGRGAEVAAAVGAASADHLLHLEPEQARALAEAGTVGVLCPATAMTVGRYPDARMMHEQGMVIALASDFNPGTSYSENLQFAIAIATRTMGLDPGEALLAATAGGAVSLNRTDVGRLAEGCQADFVILQGDDFRDLGYHAGVNLVHTVVKKGKTVFESS